MDTYPTADDVARAVIAACKVTGARPEDVLSGEPCRGGRHGKFAISRARGYAAIALHELFDCGSLAISRMVRASSWNSHLASLRAQIKNGGAPWFDPNVVVSIKLAVQAPVRPKSPVLTEDEVRSKLPAIYTGLTAYNNRPDAKRQSGPDLKKKHAEEFSGPLVMRKKVVPAEQCEDQTAYYMGDPPKERSALGDLISREIEKQAMENS